MIFLAQRKFLVVKILKLAIFAYLCFMACLTHRHPSGWLMNNFILSISTSAGPFWYLSWWKVLLKKNKTNPDILSYGFGDRLTIQDYPYSWSSTYLHVRKRKVATVFQCKSSAMTGIYPNLTVRLNSEFVSFKEEEIESTPVSISERGTLWRKGQTLRKSIQEKISDYRNWDQLEYMRWLPPLSMKTLEKTFLWMKLAWAMEMFIQILTNKAAKGHRGL